MQQSRSMTHRAPVWLSIAAASLVAACTARASAEPTKPSSATSSANSPYASEPTAGPPDLSLATELARAPAGKSRLVNWQVGYSLDYPEGWQLQGQVVASEFARDAACESVEIVDFEQPEGSVGVNLHSFVQVCSQPLEDSLSLDDFMRETYGERLPSTFDAVEFAGTSAYRTAQEGPDATIILQTQAHRLQIVSAVTAEPQAYPLRAAQVTMILESFALMR